MINKKCLTVGTMMALSAMLAGCGNEEVKDTPTTQVMTQEEVVAEVENVDVKVEDVEISESIEETKEEVEINSEEIVLPEITGEFSKFNVNGKEVQFGKTTIEELDSLFDDDEISEAEAMAAMFGIPSKADSETLAYKYHYYDMCMAALGIEVAPGQTPLVGFMVDNESYTLDDEIRNLTVDDLVAKFGDYISNTDGIYIWETDDCMFTVSYTDGLISKFAIVNKDMAEFVAPYLKEKVDNKINEDNAQPVEEVEIVSKNNLIGDVSNLYPTLHFEDSEIVLGETILTEDEGLEQVIYDKYNGRSGYGMNEFYSWTYGEWGESNSLTLSGTEIESDNEDITKFIVKSISLEITDPEVIEIEEFKGIDVESLKANLGTPYNDDSDLVWENDDVEIRVTVSGDRVTKISVSDFKFAYEQKVAEESFIGFDFETELENALLETFRDKTLEEYPGLLMKSFLEIDDEEEEE